MTPRGSKRVAATIALASVCFLSGFETFSNGQTNPDSSQNEGIGQLKSPDPSNTHSATQIGVSLSSLGLHSAGSSPSSANRKTTLGVHVSKVSTALQMHLKLPPDIGLIVEHVVEGSGAAKAGVRQFDVIHKFEDQLLVNQDQLAALVNIREPGTRVKLTIIREGASAQIQADLQAATVVGGLPFDAYHYFHGEAGKNELQQCSLCHVGGHEGTGGQTEFDNYSFFHGKPGNAKLQDCSTCHARIVRPLNLPE